MIVVNFQHSGGVKQFSDELYIRIGQISQSIVCLHSISLFSTLKAVIRHKNVLFTCNTKHVYLFVLLSYFLPLKISLILHDHKLRIGSTFREKILLRLFHLFKKRFFKVIVHSVNSGIQDSLYLRMPLHGDVVKLDTFNILQFGRIEDYKNIKFLVDLVRGFSSISLIVAGSGFVDDDLLSNINASDNISLINQYVDSNLLSRLLTSTDAMTVVYSDVTQTGLIDFALSLKKLVILSDLDEFKVFAGDVFLHLPIADLDRSRVLLLDFITKYKKLLISDADTLFSQIGMNSESDWNIYTSSICSLSRSTL